MEERDRLIRVLEKIQTAAIDGLRGTPDYAKDRLKLIKQYTEIGLSAITVDR